MSEMISISNGMADAVDVVRPSIVRVAGRRRVAATGIIWSADGLIATADHVVSRKRKTKVTLPNGETVDADVVGRDPSTDLAVLQVAAKGLTSATTADADAWRVGQLVLALGRPGRGVQATLGVLSGLGSSWRTGAGGQIEAYVQTDVLMYPGFSGGPLIDAAGQVIGLNTSALLRGVSVTVPHSTVSRVVHALHEHGEVRPGYLGIQTQTARLPQALAAELERETGVLVAGVEPDGPADGTLLLGDVVVGFNGEAIRDGDGLMAVLHATKVGDKLPINLIRAGELRDLTVKVGARPSKN